MEIGFQQKKCTRCGLCLKDCLGGILEKDPEGFPRLSPDNGKYCIKCGHCFAICPAGAVVFNGKTAGDAPPKGPVPAGNEMANLLRQRRSIRSYQPQAINPEKMTQLKEILTWTPTGCNDHKLIFSIVEDKEIMDEIRAKVTARLQFLMKSGIAQLIFPPAKRYFHDIMDGTDVIFRGAPHLIIASTPKKAPCADWDAKIALSYFDTMAQSLGLGTCWCGFAVYAFRLMPSLKKKLALPRGYRIDAAMLFGDPAIQYARPTLPEPFRIDRIKGA